MKLMKLGSVAAITLGGLMAAGPLAQAQEKKAANPAAPATPAAPAAPGAPGTPIAPRVITPEQRAARVDARLKGMSQTLTLTDDQKQKIKPILEEEMKKVEEMQQDRNIPPADRMKKFREAREASQDKIKPILTAEQQQKFESLRQRPTRRPEGPIPVPPPAAPAPAK
jgi:Spy/CpxP family protein refolding chaperone